MKLLEMGGNSLQGDNHGSFPKGGAFCSFCWEFVCFTLFWSFDCACACLDKQGGGALKLLGRLFSRWTKSNEEDKKK
jgi:hypothetical protein